MINYYQAARTNQGILKKMSVNELLFVYYDCPLGNDKQDSWSQYNYILYVVSGNKKFYSSSHSWLLASGKAVFVKKGACIIEKAHGEGLCLMTFFIPDNYLRSFLSENRTLLTKKQNNTYENDIVISLDVNDMMLTYFESVIPYFQSPVKPSEDLLELKFRELLFNIIGNPANSELTSFLHTFLLSPSNDIQPIIEANYCYNLSLGEFASLCNRSLSSFKRDFYNLYGESPARWLLNKRLAHSLMLLSNSNNTIADISFQSGFENNTHFSHAFKKHFGVSPLKYRQTNSTLDQA
jgi:AraC family transcriptional regulator, exoenzyme S synthesis regulatory protein ExsA